MGMLEDRYEKILNDLNSKNIEVTKRIIPFPGGSMNILYIKQLTNTSALSEYIIKPILIHCASLKAPIFAQLVMESVIYADDCKLFCEDDKIEQHILNGMAVLLFSNDQQYIVANTKSVVHRDISTPDLMYTTRGPRDCFVENIDSNLSLLRYRVKDKKIRIERFEVGERTKSSIAMVYIEDIANPDSVGEIRKRINGIKTDGIFESGELQSFLLNNKFNIFPQMGTIERSDLASEALLEGKIITIVDGSNLALSAPKVFSEFLYSGDDRYENKYYGLFMRVIRYLALFLSFTFSSYYIAVESFHTDVLPGEYAIALAQMRARVPYTSLLGVLILEFIVELIRESLLRVPKQIGSAIGIVGAIIIGQASIAAGLFTPVLLIIVSIEFLASFAIPDYTIMNPFRVFKFVVIIMTGAMGFYGFILGMSLIVTNLVSINSFGVPYFAPFAPYNKYDFARTLMFSRRTSPRRPKYMRLKDETRE